MESIPCYISRMGKADQEKLNLEIFLFRVAFEQEHIQTESTLHMVSKHTCFNIRFARLYDGIFNGSIGNLLKRQGT